MKTYTLYCPWAETWGRVWRDGKTVAHQILINEFIYSFIHLFIYSFIHLFVYSFIRSFVLSFVRSYLRSFLRSFVHSFTHSVNKSVNKYSQDVNQTKHFGIMKDSALQSPMRYLKY